MDVQKLHARAAGVSLAVALLTLGCEGAMGTPATGRVPPGELSDAACSRLSRGRVFFSHQSVGENIVGGIRAIIKEDARVRLNIVDDKNASGDAFFAHARLGRNGDPRGKTDAFVAALEDGLGDRLDVAMQKYCFADIDDRTDVEGLFEYYRQAMTRLHHEFPRLRIVHLTAPLVQTQGGPKAFIKKIIGRMPDHYEDNIARERFNALLRREYQGREPLFDLSSIEASGPDGRLEPLSFRGATVLELLPQYTSDGAHLNEATAKRVASALLGLLASSLSR